LAERANSALSDGEIEPMEAEPYKITNHADKRIVTILGLRYNK